MARNTPKKSNSNLEQEIQALKETKAGQFNYLNATSFLGNCSTVSVYKNVYGQSLLKLKIRLSMEGSLINLFYFKLLYNGADSFSIVFYQ